MRGLLLALLLLPLAAGAQVHPYAPAEDTSMLELSKSGGDQRVNKFGCTTFADTAEGTDVWDRANEVSDQPVWLVPTAARLHTIASTGTGDVDTGSSTGARTVQIYGLQTWDSAESNEIVSMNGSTGVSTANSYVIIHRMKVLTSGASGPNEQTITATAAVDGTVTAQIMPGKGQTLMAVYGVPSGYTAYMTKYYAGTLKSGGNANGVADLTILASMDIENQPTVFIVKHFSSISVNGTTVLEHEFAPYKSFRGPVVIKLRATSSFDATITGGFDIFLVKE